MHTAMRYRGPAERPRLVPIRERAWAVEVNGTRLSDPECFDPRESRGTGFLYGAVQKSLTCALRSAGATPHHLICDRGDSLDQDTPPLTNVYCTMAGCGCRSSPSARLAAISRHSVRPRTVLPARCASLLWKDSFERISERI